jgi:hypothetical protein
VRALAALSLVFLAAAPLSAQRAPRVELTLPAQGTLAADGPLVRAIGMLSSPQLRDLLRNGFPTRLHYRVDLWSTGGWFNDLKRSTEWDVVVRYDPLDRRFRVARIIGDRVTVLGSFDQIEGAEDAIERPFEAPITAPSRGRFYYNAVVEVETLSLSDLDEVERWLRGEARPAVRGQRNPGTALARGVRTLFVRMLGGDTRAYEVRSSTFRP